MKSLNVVWASVAIAIAMLLAAPAQAAPPECTPAGDCTAYKNRVTFPANALSYGYAAFTLNPQGVNWPGGTGTMSLTVRRPINFNGNKVRLTVVYQTTSGETGTLAFGVTAIAFHHGSGFETYGGFVSNVFDVPGDSTGLYEQSVVVEPGQGWVPGGPWWYFQINRLGTHVDTLLVMAVVLEY